MNGNLKPRSPAFTRPLDDSRVFGFAIVVSFLGHIVFFAAMILMPDLSPFKRTPPSVIQVTMVSLPSPGGGGDAKPEPEKPLPENIAEPVPPAPEKPPLQTQEIPIPTAPPELSIQEPIEIPDPLSLAPEAVKPKPKTSLKKKTLKHKKVVQQPRDKDKKKTVTPKKDTLQDTLARMKKKVDQQTADRQTPGAKTTGKDGRPGPAGGGDTPGGGPASAIQIYAEAIARRVQQNWAFSYQLAGISQKLLTVVAFKVMPNGIIRDIYYMERSGNAYLDESAKRAVMKSNPVLPHPVGVLKPYVEMGLYFTPEGVQ